MNANGQSQVSDHQQREMTGNYQQLMAQLSGNLELLHEVGVALRARKQKRVFLAIDAENVCRSKDDQIRQGCYQKLLRFAEKYGRLEKAAVYLPFRGWDHSRQQTGAAKRLGFTRVVCRPHRRRPDNERPKTDTDTVIILDVYAAALRHQIDVVVLVTGDSDLIALIERLRDLGIEVICVGPKDHTANELPVVCDEFWCIDELGELARDGEPTRSSRQHHKPVMTC